MLPSRGLATGDFYERLSLVLTPRSAEGEQLVSQPQLRIGIVAGHSGNDSGAVCYDGNNNVTLTEVDVNLKIAAIVQQQLTQKGFQVDLLREFDTRLNIAPSRSSPFITTPVNTSTMKPPVLKLPPRSTPTMSTARTASPPAWSIGI
jgi:hypothetical protein